MLFTYSYMFDCSFLNNCIFIDNNEGAYIFFVYHDALSKDVAMIPSSSPSCDVLQCIV